MDKCGASKLAFEVLESRQMLSADSKSFSFAEHASHTTTNAIPDLINVGARQYDPTVGYGWVDSSGLSPNGDSISGARGGDGAFRIDVPDGDYHVRIVMGDEKSGHDFMRVSIDDQHLYQVSTTLRDPTEQIDETVTITDGVLRLVFDDAGGDPFWSVRHISLSRLSDIPQAQVGSVPKLLGDYNLDGHVNAGDLEVWRESFGDYVGTTYTGADGNGNGTIDYADYQVWREHFGQKLPEDPPPAPNPDPTDPHEHKEPIPDFASSPTIVAATSGDWSNPASWSTGRVPMATDIAVIPEEIEITISDTDAIVDRLVVHGTLKFATDVDTRLRVSTLHVEQHGALVAGTEQSPVTANLEIIIRDTPLDLSLDPERYGTGMLVEGTISIHGRPDPSPNVSLTSENPSGTRGHILVTGTAQLDGVEIRDLGRTKLDPLSAENHVGRYALHIHLAGDKGYEIYVRNSLIHDTLPSVWRHGIAIHGTHGITVSGNTIRNKAGSGIYLEDGTERANVIENNLIEDIVGVATRSDGRGMTDLGFEGSGIWARGTDNYIRNNTVRRANFGYLYFQMYVPSGNYKTPVREFSGNVAENCVKGLEYWWIGGYQGDEATGPSVFDITARNCQWGVYNYNSGDVVITGTIENCDYGVDGGDYLARRWSVVDATITGCLIGIIPTTHSIEPMRIENCYLDNAVDIQMRTLYSSGFGANVPARRVEVVNTELLGDVKIKLIYALGGSWNVVQKDEIVVTTPTESYRVYYHEQRADFVMPEAVPGSQGAPVAGLTNQENWNLHGLAVAGAVAPAEAVERAGIYGLVMPR